MKICLCIILLAFLSENLILFFKTKTVANFIEQFKYSIKISGILHTIMYSLNFILNSFFSLCKSLYKQKTDCTTDCIRILISAQGGFGDLLIFANWFEYFREKFFNATTFAYLYNQNGIKNIYNYPIQNVTILDTKNIIQNEQYDLQICVLRFPIIEKCNSKKIKELNPKLFSYIKKCNKYYNENKLFIDYKPYLDGFLDTISIVKEIKRYEQPDIYNLLRITEDFKLQILSSVNEENYLKSLKLNNKKFITIHRGWDSHYTNSVKAWSLNSCKNLLEALKNEFPNYSIVLFGKDRNQSISPQGADINLLEKTSLEEAKILLKNSSLHIDNEGGLVHLRHALKGGPSVVLFGPTSKEVFGYSENINIKSKTCPYGCEWISKDWMLHCAKGYKTPLCMESIKTHDVINAAKKILRSAK